MVAEKNYVYVCRKCKRPHSPEEFNESRYCRNCETFLSEKDLKFPNSVSVRGDKGYLSKEEILDLIEKHDRKNLWWIKQEEIIGNQLRKSMKLSKDNLYKIIEWKFESNALVKTVQLNRVKKIEEQQLETISNQVFNLNVDHDLQRINLLCIFKGIGPAVASVILTFFDPENYCVLDFHVYQEVFGIRPKSLTPEKYVRLLRRFRGEAKIHNLRVRDIEKAYFFKNCEMI